MHLAIGPVVLGRGEPLLQGIDLPALGLTSVKLIHGEGASHYWLTR